MRNPYWQNLRILFKHFVTHNNVTWRMSEYEIFFEIEALLHLYEQLTPEANKRTIQNTWALVSGYFVTQTIRENETAQEQILNMRHNTRYVKTATAWRFWLKWYSEQPVELRLYHIERVQKERIYQQRTGVDLRQERLDAYKGLYDAVALHPIREEEHIQATAVYTFFTNEQKNQVKFPELFLAHTAERVPRNLAVPSQSVKPVVEVDLAILLDVAREVDSKHAELGLEPSNFYQRVAELQFVTQSSGKTVENNMNMVQVTSSICIDGLFHLVGALGIGKSTLIKLLVYYLAHHEQRHISIIMNTVVEAYEIARWLRLMGVSATPALGQNRASHAKRVGFANEAIFAPQTILHNPNINEPLYRWMPKPCALSALAENPIPLGEEPCFGLKADDGNRYQCPLLPTCPVHQVARDLHNSQVWVLNPASFIYSRAPEGMGTSSMRLSEAVYHLSDLLIIDEADRVQANWDCAFAPTSIVLGADDALIDWLHRRLTEMTVGEGRNNVSRQAITQLTKLDAQCDMLANRVYNLFSYGRKNQLVQWITNRQITNEALFRHLLKDLENKFPKEMNNDEKDQRFVKLQASFEQYWKQPLTRQGGFLAAWLREYLGSDTQRRSHDKQLDDWVVRQMGWEKVTAKERFICRQLDLAVTLTALITRINSLRYLLRWTEDEIRQNLPLRNPDIPDFLKNIMPEPPLGQVLGLRIITDPKQSHRSFHTLRYQGVGRWLLLNFHKLFKERDGIVGPHILLTSATSWMPRSAIYHIEQTPHAILSRKDCSTQASVDIRFTPINANGRPLRVSGANRHKEHNLRRMVRELVPDIEKELAFWQRKGEARCVLLVVNSYEQAHWVIDEIERTDNLGKRALRLFPDDSEIVLSGIRTREVETFYEHQTDVLIAPLMAIQRGFNILDELGNALLGTAFFLVRPFPPPHDLMPQIMSLNRWYMKQLQDYGRILNPKYADGVDGVQEMRRQAQRQWIRRLRGKGTVASLDDILYQEFLRDSFVTIWQTIGRMIRGGSDARVFFIDQAFGDIEGSRNILNDWHQMLARLFETDDPFKKHLAQELYKTAWQAFDTAKNQRSI